MKLLNPVKKFARFLKLRRASFSNVESIETPLKYMVFAHARTGSSNLLTILNVHPLIKLAPEPFINNDLYLYKRKNPNLPDNQKLKINNTDNLKEALLQISQEYSGFKHVIGNLGTVLELNLLVQKNIKIIFLQRRNILQVAISQIIAKELGDWRCMAERWRERFNKHQFNPINVDIIKNEMTKLQKINDYYKKFIEKHNIQVFNLYYEDLFGESVTIEQKMRILSQIHDFFGVHRMINPNRLAKIQQRFNPAQFKLNTEATYKQIPNYQEIEQKCGSDERGWLFKKA